jgi:hypothetical protein
MQQRAGKRNRERIRNELHFKKCYLPEDLLQLTKGRRRNNTGYLFEGQDKQKFGFKVSKSYFAHNE